MTPATREKYLLWFLKKTDIYFLHKGGKLVCQSQITTSVGQETYQSRLIWWNNTQQKWEKEGNEYVENQPSSMSACVTNY